MKKPKQKTTIKRENWNGRYIYVVRDENKRILSKLPLKGSNLDLSEVKQKYKQTNTLRPNTTKIKRGGTTSILISSDSTKVPRRLKQIGLRVSWYNRRGRFVGETLGYSNLLHKVANKKEAQDQAFAMARGVASTSGLINYDFINFKIEEVFYQTYITQT